MMQRIPIRLVFVGVATPGDSFTVDLKPAETIVSVSEYDAIDEVYTVAIAGPREDIAPEGTSA